MRCSDTPFLTEKHVSRTGIRHGGCGSCSDTPFHKETVYREHTEREKRRCDAAIDHFGGKIVCRDKGKDSEKGNRAAIHHFGPRTLYREHRKREKYRCCAATHLFNQESMCRGQGSGTEDVVRARTHHFRRKKLCREHGEGEKQTKSTPQRTTRYDHTTHHNRTKQNTHTHTRQHYQHTKPHTIPQTPYATPHTTKALPPKRRKSFIEIYQGQLGLEPTGFPSLPEAKTSDCTEATI